MKKPNSSSADLRLFLIALLLPALLYACDQKRDWQDVWADISPAQARVADNTPLPESLDAAVPVRSPAEIAASLAPYLFTLSDGGKNIGRGVLLKPATGLALAYVGDYQGGTASALLAGKSHAVSLSGHDASTGFAMAEIEGVSASVAPLRCSADIIQGEELLLVASSGSAPLIVETRAAQSGAAAGPLFTAFPVARNLAGGLTLKRDGSVAGITLVPQNSDLMAWLPSEYLLGRCAALAALPPAPEPVACPLPPPCPALAPEAEKTEEKTVSDALPPPSAAAWLGAGVIELNPAWAKKNGVLRESGLYIKEVRAASPLESAGVKVGDLLLELNGKPLETLPQLSEAMQTLRPGQPATVKTLSSEGRTLTLAVTPGVKVD